MPWRVLKTAIFSFMAPGTVGVLGPQWLKHGRSELPLVVRGLGLPVFLAGVAIYLWCAWDFVVKGLGTPAPIDAPRRLVVEGLYRFTRNPMYVGVSAMILGQAIYYWSWSILVYLFVIVLGFHLFVRRYEEPTLGRLFGRQYHDYCRQVPRWLVRTAARDSGILVLSLLATVLSHPVVNGQYGFHRDELLTFDNARHLAWLDVHDKSAWGSLNSKVMRFDLITIFPEFFAGPLDYGIVRRARQAGITEIHIQDLREFTQDRHRTVDDRPFGGGEGMVLKPAPVFEAVEKLLERSVGNSEGKIPPPENAAIVLLSAAGRLFTQQTARHFAGLERLILICGRYEGVDERVAEHLATDEISIGDYVLSGGELPAAILIDAITRLLPGAVGNEASTENESFHEYEGMASAPERARGVLLDFPHYTRPAEYRGWKVPSILIGGHHAEVAKWRRQMALEKTRRNRPDLLGENA